MKELLIINDMCGHSKVATAAMLPILSYLGIPTCNLPTALVSNNLEYGRFALLDTTDYIKQTFKVWKELGFKASAIATGFIASEAQAALIADYCSEQSQQGTSVFVDPIMGDEGKLYNGVTESTIRSMRKLLQVAHICVPNYTEACFLADIPYTEDSLPEREAYLLVDRLREIGARSVVITSMNINGGKAVVGYNCSTKEYFCLPYNEIPVRFPGTGDIFSSILYGNLLKGTSLEESTQKAMDIVAQMIFLSKDQEDKFRGIPVERYLNLL